MKVILNTWERETLARALWFSLNLWPRDTFAPGRRQWADWLHSLGGAARSVEMDEAQVKDIADCLAYMCAGEGATPDEEALLLKLVRPLGRTPEDVERVLAAASAVVAVVRQ